MILSVEEERLWSKVDVRGKDECWEFQQQSRLHGYGVVGFRGRNTMAHRLAWRFWNSSDIPEGMVVMHECDNRACCSPNHLKLGTQQKNIFDAHARKRTWQSKRTHCPKGHPYEEGNLYTEKGRNGRKCRTCTIESAKRSYLRRKGLVA